MQVAIAKHGLQTLLSTNYYFTELLSSDMLDKEPEQKLVWLCGGILSNVALHPNNRYAALHCTANLSCLGPVSFTSVAQYLAFIPWSPALLLLHLP